MGKYSIGLDLRPNGVGWGVTDQYGRLLKKNGRHLFGTAVFDEAESAKERRRYRSQRRQQQREKARIDALQGLLERDVLQKDSAFYIRLDDASSDGDDRLTANLYETLPEYLFEDQSELVFNPKKRRRAIPIYMIREALATQKKKADIRYVYLAIAHIIKHRGYFTDDSGQSEESRLAEASVNLEQYLRYVCDNYFLVIPLDNDSEGIKAYLNAVAQEDSPDKARELENIIQASFTPGEKETKVLYAVTELLRGNTVDLSEILPQKRKRGLISFASLQSSHVYDKLPEEASDAIHCLENVYEWVYQTMLSRREPETTVAAEMNERYRRHQKDLQELKAWFRKYKTCEDYRVFFHSDMEDSNYNAYAKSRTGKTNTTDKWNHCSQEKFYRSLRNILLFNDQKPGEEETKNPLAAEAVQAAQPMLKKMFTADDGEVIPNGFLPLQRISLNSRITNRQQYCELKRIIENQAGYYPTLRENAEKILALCTFRIPYYVGPLRQNGKSPFTPWIRYKSAGGGPIMPWNLSDRVDLAATAGAWVEQATNRCTYLTGKKVLPKHSLAYEEYMLLEELNTMRVYCDDEYIEPTEQQGMQEAGVDNKKSKQSRNDRLKIITPEIKRLLIENVFTKQKKYSVNSVCRWLEQHVYRGVKNVRLVTRSGKPVDAIHASLSARIDMERILGKNGIQGREDILEDIIKWSTLYTDRKIYIQLLHEKLSGVLTYDQIKQMEGLKYSGWGRYSKELLCDPLCRYKGEDVSVLDVMRERHQTFMKVYHTKEYGFKEKIAQYNQEHLREDLTYDEIAGMVTSPAMKRTIWTAVRIIRELTQAMKEPPECIFIRNLRESNSMKKSLADMNITRYERLQAYYDTYEKTTGEKIDPNIKATLRSKHGKEISDVDYLYLLQLGRCMYTGEKIDLRSPSTYIMDYAVPLYLSSDETLMNNRVLVKKNNRVPGMPLARYTISVMKPYWEKLLRVGMITRQKYNGLIIEQYNDETYQFFMKNQVTESNLIIEKMTWILRNWYPDSIIYGINARLTDQFRKINNLPRITDLNDMQQAFDAFLTAHAGSFIARYMPGIMEDGGLEQIRLKKKEKSGAGDKNGAFFKAYCENQPDEGDGSQSVWRNKEDREKYIQKVYAWHDGFVTRKVREYTGKYYFETLFRPVKAEDQYLVTKKGSHKQAYVAYMDVIQYTDRHGEEWKELVSIPAFIAARKNPALELSYIENALGFNSDKKIKDLSIARRKVLLNQETIIDGHPYYLRTASEWINAKQLYIRPEYAESVWLALSVKMPHKEEPRLTSRQEDSLRETAVYLTEKMLTQYPIYQKLNNSLDENKEAIPRMSVPDLMLLIKALVYSMGTRSERAQPALKKIGKVKIEGDNRLMNKRLRGKTVELINRSVTGLYVKKEIV